MNETDYLVIRGVKYVTSWQRCISCKREVFAIQSVENVICDECRTFDESRRGDGGGCEYPQSRASQKEKIPDEIRWATWERDNFTCLKCGTRRNLTVDHVYPEALGGKATMDNTQTLCRRCNSSKGKRL